MNALRLFVVGMLAVAMTVDGRTAEKKDTPDNAKLLVGKWEVSKDSRQMPLGSVMEFGKDGKLKVSVKVADVTKSVEMTYKVEGDKLLLTRLVDGKEERRPPASFKKLTATEMILMGETEKESLEFKRVK